MESIVRFFLGRRRFPIRCGQGDVAAVPVYDQPRRPEFFWGRRRVPTSPAQDEAAAYDEHRMPMLADSDDDSDDSDCDDSVRMGFGCGDVIGFQVKCVGFHVES